MERYKKLFKEVRDTKDVISDAEDMLEEAKRHIEDTVASLEMFMKLIRPIDIRLAEEAKRYTIEHLKRFINDQRHMGSISNLYMGLQHNRKEGTE
jgi:hypothetical protein